MASQSGGGESSDLSGSVEKQGALAMLANMQLSSERIRELSDGARGDPCLMLNLYFSQEESNKRSSSIIPPAKRSRSVRVVNAAAAGEKAVAEAAAKKKEEEEARVEELIKQHEEAAEEEEVELEVEELIERYGVSTGVGWKEEFWVKNRDVPASDGDGDENGAEAKGSPEESVDGGEEEAELQAASARSAPQSGDGEGDAVGVRARPLVEALEHAVASMQAVIDELRAREARGGRRVG